MPINFHDKEVNSTYSSREAHDTWIEEMKKQIIDHPLINVADIGCGGGIYSKALLHLGAESVIGIDNSVPILDQAQKSNSNYNQIKFQLGTAEKTGIENQSLDLVLERALIHHLNVYCLNFQEVQRILKEDGLLIIQDRTPKNCFLPGGQNHIRGYFFSKFPHLRKIEEKRREDLRMKELFKN